jgi:phthalate 4,5-dioxygenase oxygenase subunit
LMSSEVEEADGDPVRVKVLGEDLIAFRDSDGVVGLIDAYCAHRGAPLFFGRNEDCGLRCIYHGWKYDVNGACVDMPNEPPTSRFKDRIKMTAYPTKEAGGLVFAYLGPPELQPPLPQLDFMTVPPEHIHMGKDIVESNFLQAVEGDHDSSHASSLHSSLDDGFSDPWANVERRPSHARAHMVDKAPIIHVLETPYGFITGAKRTLSDTHNFWRIVPYMMPYFSLIAAEPGAPMTVNVRTPVDDEHAILFRIHYKPNEPFSKREVEVLETIGAMFSKHVPGTFRPAENKDNDYLIDRTRQRYETTSGIHSVPSQDRAVQETMRPSALGPHTADRSNEHLGSADASIVMLRQRLQRAAEDLEKGLEPPSAFEPEMFRLRAPALALPEGVMFDVGAADYINAERPWQMPDEEPAE